MSWQITNYAFYHIIPGIVGVSIPFVNKLIISTCTQRVEKYTLNYNGHSFLLGLDSFIIDLNPAGRKKVYVVFVKKCFLKKKKNKIDEYASSEIPALL